MGGGVGRKHFCLQKILRLLTSNRNIREPMKIQVLSILTRMNPKKQKIQAAAKKNCGWEKTFHMYLSVQHISEQYCAHPSYDPFYWQTVIQLAGQGAGIARNSFAESAFNIFLLTVISCPFNVFFIYLNRG